MAANAVFLMAAIATAAMRIFSLCVVEVDSRFFYLVTDASGSLPRAGRLTPGAGLMDPARKAGTVGDGDRSHHVFVEIGKISLNNPRFLEVVQIIDHLRQSKPESSRPFLHRC